MEDGHIHETNHGLMERCREVHYELAKKHNWHRIELQQKKQDTFDLIWDFVAKQLPS